MHYLMGAEKVGILPYNYYMNKEIKFLNCLY
jgi:hypothetical protein